MSNSIFSLFDEGQGQVALISNGIDKEKADVICNKVAISVMANITKLDEPSEIVGESVIPLIEENIVALVYYFFIKADHLRNDAFSFVLYSQPLNKREEIYSNMSNIIPKLKTIADDIKNEVEIKLPAKQNTVLSTNIVESLKELSLPLDKLLKDKYNEATIQFLENLDFIENVAFSVFNGSDLSVEVLFSDRVEEEIIKKLTVRITYGLLIKIAEKKQEGEAILPLIDTNQMVFTYFFPLKNKTGIFQLFVDNKNRMMIYRWASLLSKHLNSLAKEFKKGKFSLILPKKLENQLKELYYFDSFAYDNIFRKSVVATEVDVIDFSQRILKLKSLEKVLYALIIGKTVILTDCTLNEVKEFINFFNNILPYRNIEYEERDTFVEEIIKEHTVIYIPEAKIQKKLLKNITLIEFNKNRTKSKLNNRYIHHLGKIIKSKNLDQISSIIHDELSLALDEVSKLIEHARTEDKNEAKKLIIQQMISLPLNSLFDLINDLALYYNPILADVIENYAIKLTLSML